MTLARFNPKKGKGLSLRCGARAVAIAFACALLAGCAGGPAYGPAGSSGGVGYSERRLSADRYRVSFTGAPNTGLEDVKRNLMRRAAEVALAAGYSHFAILTDRSEAQVYEPPDADVARSDRGLATSYIRREGGRYSPATGWPLANYRPGDSTPRARYSATAEIVLLKGAEANRNPDALSARAILDRNTGRAAPAGAS